MKKIFIPICVVASILFSSCASVDETFSAVTVAPTSLASGVKYTVNRSEALGGTSLGCTLFGVAVGKPTIEEAVKDAIKDEGPNCVGLADVVVLHNVNTSLLVIGDHAIAVTGYPIIKHNR